MEIIIEELFKEQLKKCPVSFQTEFRKVYQQLKVIDKPTEIKNIIAVGYIKNYYKLTIDKSRIGMFVKLGKLHVACFLYNPYFE